MVHHSLNQKGKEASTYDFHGQLISIGSLDCWYSHLLTNQILGTVFQGENA